MNRRIQVSAAGEKIWPMAWRRAPRKAPALQRNLMIKVPARRESSPTAMEPDGALAVERAGNVSRRTGTMNDVAHPTDYERIGCRSALDRLAGAGRRGLSRRHAVCAAGGLSRAPTGSAACRPILPLPPAPRLQVHPKDDLDRLHADGARRD